MRILALIPARGGSKGVPRKNVKALGGKPLIAYSIEAGLASMQIDHVVVSTEDEEIAKISRRLGAAVPFLRPAQLATDHSPTVDTVLHAIRFFEAENNFFDAVCLLQPTVPFRSGADLDAAITMFKKQEADCLFTVREVPHVYNPHWVYELDEGSGFLKMAVGNEELISRRQDLPKAFHRDGSVYLTRKEVLLNKHSLYGEKIAHYQMKDSPDINIDTLDDWAKAESYLRNIIE